MIAHFLILLLGKVSRVMKLAEKIMTLRKQRGWSQEELAQQLSVSRQSVSKWESGASVPDLDKILKMSEIFWCIHRHSFKRRNGVEREKNNI